MIRTRAAGKSGLHERERCGVLCQAVHGCSFPCHALDQHTDGHATRESVWVDYYIGLYSAFAKGHVDHWPFLGADTFLSVPRREFVTNHRRARDPERDMYFLQLRITSVASCCQLGRLDEKMKCDNRAYQEDELDQHTLFRHLCTSQSRSVPWYRRHKPR